MTRSTLWYFGPGRADGSARDKALLGGKGTNLAEMARLGLPVPPGFTITTEVCHRYFEQGRGVTGGYSQRRLRRAVLDRREGGAYVR